MIENRIECYNFSKDLNCVVGWAMWADFKAAIANGMIIKTTI